MKAKLLSISILTLAFSLGALAQIKDYSYKFTVKGVKEKDTIYLANYFGKQLYYNDTAYVDKTGSFTFKKKREITPGQFAVVLPGSNFFQIFINEQTFNAKTDTTDFVKNMVFEGSKENELYYTYIKFLGKMKEDIEPVRKAFEEEKNEKEKEKLRLKLIAADSTVKAYQKKIGKENANLLAGQVIGMNVDIDVPDAPKKADGTIDSTWAYYYYRDHYFDNSHLENESIVRTEAFHNRLEYFFNKVVLQNPDTICAVTENLVKKMNPKGDLFKYTVNHVTNSYNKSNIMGMDAVFVCMADKFYLNKRAYWADTASLSKIRERAEALRPTLLGTSCHPLSLADTTGNNWIKLANIKANYTILVFWDPDCGHCKKEIPLLAQLYNDGLKKKGVEIYAVSSEDGEKWKKFIVENKLNFINTAVPEKVRKDQDFVYKVVSEGKSDLKSLNYHQTFDVYSTPKLFLLDKDKKIVAKQIGADQVEEIINKFLENDKKKI